MMEVPASLARYIETRDRRVSKSSGWDNNPISKSMEDLQNFGEVTVGGRSSCGGKVDPSWVEFTSWNEVVAKARKMGIRIQIEPIKHGNAWATKCGGFWSENRYTLEKE